MPSSLKSQIKKLKYKGLITPEEYDSLVKKLEGHDRHVKVNLINDIKADVIEQNLDDKEKMLNYLLDKIDDILEAVR